MAGSISQGSHTGGLSVCVRVASVHREMLDQSAAELKATIDELEKRFDSIENEGIHLLLLFCDCIQF